MWPTARRRALRRAADAAGEVGFPASGTVDPIQAGALLHALHDVLLEEASAAAQSMSPVAWMWYLRRLPTSVFEGEWATTEPYDLMLAETLSSASRRPEPPLPTTTGMVAFDIDDIALRPVFELCGWAATLSAIQSTLRRAGKGMAVSLADEGLPWSVDDDDLDAAIELYDRRVEQDHGALVAGTESLSQLAEDSDTLPLLCAQRLPAWQNLPGWAGPLVERRDRLRVHGRWFVDMLTIDRLVQMLSGTGGEAQGWWDPGLPALVLLLRGMALDAVHDSQVAGLTLPRVGYVLLPEARLRSTLDACLERGYAEDLRGLFGDALPASGAEILAAAARVPVSAFPLAPGPLVRPVHERVLVDVGAATQRLLRMVTVPSGKGGTLPNVRATHYEQVVRDVVDATSWRPDGEARLLVGRTLRRNGRSITDLDAVAVHDRTLLLLSCKSLPYSEELDAGVHTAVRNARTLVEEACRRWDDVVTELTAYPVGTNYDVSGFEHVAGAVVVPHVIFSADREVLADVSNIPAGLRKVSSVSELRRWLAATGSD